MKDTHTMIRVFQRFLYTKRKLTTFFLLLSVLVGTSGCLDGMESGKEQGASGEIIANEVTESTNIVAEMITSENSTIEISTTERITTEGPTTEEITTEETIEIPNDGEIVRVREFIPGIWVDLVYGTNRNFTGQVIYGFHDAYLRYSAVKKLKQVQEKLEKKSLSLLIWDGFRPVQAQFVLYDVCPDSTYVANPYNGYSNHSRGNAVDLTIADMDGNPIVMPTGFDDFSTKADRDYSDCTDEEMENALLLETLMTEAGFEPYFGEWWHFTENNFYEPVLDVSMEDLEELERKHDK